MGGASIEQTDAGLREQDHYRSRLPSWRYAPRQWLLPYVRAETPYLAAFQKALRTPTLDSYFMITANLGSHTFFMIFLPVLFWCGQPALGRASVHILGAGVFFTGFLKDMMCLPRPLSPPVQRITMSLHTALEYGFPSTHSTNALSAVVYTLLALNDPQTVISSGLKSGLLALLSLYSVTIVLGRLYCGMHGFLDVTVGGTMGAIISIIQFNALPYYDAWFLSGGPGNIVILLVTILALIRIHPEPADDCPCFDDSVAFAGVIIGIDAAVWLQAQEFVGANPVIIGTRFGIDRVGLLLAVLRVFVGIATIVAWRAIAKKVLLSSLPPLFRLIGRAGFLLPRRFFQQAPDYESVPSGIQMDSLIPPISKLPAFFNSIAHPRKSGSISIGPQSAADAYETIAYRQQVRRNSKTMAETPYTGTRQRVGKRQDMASNYNDTDEGTTELSSLQKPQMLPTPASSTTDLQGSGLEPFPVLRPLTPPHSNQGNAARSRTPSADRRKEEEEDKAVFESLPKPRARFDIEIATKLVVYSGIGFLAAAGMPIVFTTVGWV